MVRSGWSISSWRAFSPTIISPLGESDTMLGTSGRTAGLVRSIQATRLLVVPRSIPTTLSLSNSIWNMGLVYEIRYVLSAVQQPPNGGEGFAVNGRIPTRKRLLQFGIELDPHAFKSLARRLQLLNIGFFER